MINENPSPSTSVIAFFPPMRNGVIVIIISSTIPCLINSQLTVPPPSTSRVLIFFLDKIRKRFFMFTFVLPELIISRGCLSSLEIFFIDAFFEIAIIVGNFLYAGQRLKLTRPHVTSKTYAAKAKASKKTNKTVAKKPANKKPEKIINHKWNWPTKGKVIRTYSSRLGGNKGIDIAGKIGQPVLAASSGKVVYSGNGLSGYGNLIIVKHSEQFLSAYAHNKRLFVKEGGEVKLGEKIAELGKSGTTEPKLHFEIRYKGKPVDPLKYLPKL